MDISGVLGGIGFEQGLFYAFVFAAVVAAVFGVGLLLRPTGDVHRRLMGPGAAAPDKPASLRYARSGLHDVLVGPVQEALASKDKKELTSLRLRLIQAGFYAPHAVPAYYGSRVGLFLLLPALATLTILIIPPLSQNMTVNNLILTILMLALTGYAAPTLILRQRIASRQQAIGNGLPDVLDLLLVCVEAGQGLDTAISNISGEIGVAHPLLSEHLSIMGAELRAGSSRDQALRNFADRVGTEEVAALTTLLIQSDALGTSTADALRAYSDDMRLRRVLKAEERAQKMGVKLTFPMILLIMPALIIVIMSPSIIQIGRHFFTFAQNLKH